MLEFQCKDKKTSLNIFFNFQLNNIYYYNTNLHLINQKEREGKLEAFYS